MTSQPLPLRNIPLSLADIPTDVSRLAIAVLAGLVLYTGAVGIYRLFFHPLRSYPGPKLAAVSEIPLLLNRFAGEQHFWTKKLHDQYGPVVRVGPNELSYITYEAWKDIYGHRNGDRGNFSKDPDQILEFIGGRNSIIFAEDDDHTRQRRLVSHAFSDKAMREQEPLILEYVNALVSKLSDIARESKGTKAVDMVDWYSFATFDVIADLTFGEELGMLKRAEWVPWLSAAFNGIKHGVYVSSLRTYWPTFAPLVDYFTPQYLKDAGILHVTESEKRVNARLERGSDRPDIWSFITRHGSNEKKSLSLPEMHGMGKVLMIAGTETSATLLSGMTHYLTTHPDKMARLVAEIRGAFPDSEDMNMPALAHLPYLHAVIEETLRMYPPVPLGLPRIVPQGGRIVDGKYVPGGTRVYVSQWAAYHWEGNFASPFEFAPERWLSDMPDKRFEADKRDVMQAFSVGPRNCLGKNLAYNETRLIFAKMIYHFDLKATKESENWHDQKVYGLNLKSPLMITPVLASRT